MSTATPLSVVTVQCFFSNTLLAPVRIHITNAVGSIDVVVFGGTTVSAFIREGPAVVSIFDLGNGALIINLPINVNPAVHTPTWTILNGRQLQFPDGHIE
jgi:hypothetical protein